MEYLAVFTLGGLLYGLIEILWRGWTHWTMLICGGICFTLMYFIAALPIKRARRLVLSAAAITTVEFFAGCAVNLRLGLHVWDYSGMPFDLLGQICPAFSALWLILSAPGLCLCRALRQFLRGARDGQ